MVRWDEENPGKRTGPLFAQDDPVFTVKHRYAKAGSGHKNTETLAFYVKIQDFKMDQAKRIADRIAMCPYALGARFIPEVVIQKLGNYRIEVVVDADGSATLNEGSSTGFKWVTEHAV